MEPKDRRTGDERRGTKRFPVEIDVEWEVGGVRQIGVMNDVSFDGCFILSSGDVIDGDAVRLFVPLADGMKVQFGGKIANHVYEIGFGVRFEPLSAPQRDLLVNLVRSTNR